MHPGSHRSPSVGSSSVPTSYRSNALRDQSIGRPVPRYDHPEDPPRFIHDGQLWGFQGDLLDKLTDPTLYTGSHKHRFDERGKGRGAVGRDLGARGTGSTVRPVAPEMDIRGTAWASGLRGSLYEPKQSVATGYRAGSIGRQYGKSPRSARSHKSPRSSWPQQSPRLETTPRHWNRRSKSDGLTPAQAEDFANLDRIEARLGIPYDPLVYDPFDPEAEVAARWNYIERYFPLQ